MFTVFAGSVETLFAARIFTGIGANIATTIAISIAADLSPPERRGRSLLVLTVGQYAGMALSFALGGQLLGVFKHGGLLGQSDWRSVHLALGLASAVVTVAILALREPSRREQEAINPPPRQIMSERWARRLFLIPLFLGQVGVFMVDSTATIWAVPVLRRDLGLAAENVAGWMGAVVFSAGVVGALVGGFAADFGHRKGGRGGVLIGAVIASVLALPAAASHSGERATLRARTFCAASRWEHNWFGHRYLHRRPSPQRAARLVHRYLHRFCGPDRFRGWPSASGDDEHGPWRRG